jgi:hypothetical protein
MGVGTSQRQQGTIRDKAFVLLLLENSYQQWLADLFSNNKGGVMQWHGVKQRGFQSEVDFWVDLLARMHIFKDRGGSWTIHWRPLLQETSFGQTRATTATHIFIIISIVNSFPFGRFWKELDGGQSARNMLFALSGHHHPPKMGSASTSIMLWQPKCWVHMV